MSAGSLRFSVLGSGSASVGAGTVPPRVSVAVMAESQPVDDADNSTMKASAVSLIRGILNGIRCAGRDNGSVGLRTRSGHWPKLNVGTGL